jgi:hypothetical protein
MDFDEMEESYFSFLNRTKKLYRDPYSENLLAELAGASQPNVAALPGVRRDVVWVVHAEELLRCWLEPWGPVCLTAEKMSPEVLIKRRLEYERLMSPPPPAQVAPPEIKPPAVPKPKPAAVAPPENGTGYDWTKK